MGIEPTLAPCDPAYKAGTLHSVCSTPCGAPADPRRRGKLKLNIHNSKRSSKTCQAKSALYFHNPKLERETGVEPAGR